MMTRDEAGLVGRDVLIDKMLATEEVGLEALFEEHVEEGSVGYVMRVPFVADEDGEKRWIVVHPSFHYHHEDANRAAFEQAFDTGLAAIRTHPQYHLTKEIAR